MPGRHRRRRGDGFERSGQALGGGPGGEAAVARTVHGDAAIAPGLARNPADDRPCIIAVALERIDFARTSAFTAPIGDDADVAVRGAFLCGVPRRDIDRELEKRRQSARLVLRTHEHRGETARTGYLDEKVLVRHIAACIIVGLERIDERPESAGCLEIEVRPDEIRSLPAESASPSRGADRTRAAGRRGRRPAASRATT